MISLGFGERQLAQDAADMFVDSAPADPQLAGDTGVRPALGHELEDLALARREVAKRIFNSPRRDQLFYQSRVDDRTAVGDSLEGIKKVPHLRDSALQQVANPAPFGEQVHRAVDLDVGREHQDADLGEFSADRLRGIETLSCMGGGHANVQHHERWDVLTHQPHQPGHIARQADNLKARRFEQAGDALAQEDIVVCDHHAEASHGRIASFCHRIVDRG
jgi:hypothetical protein